ncbi:hypothetical protein QO004_002197 [Rhizobium mesoamericanum]|nr:hypothetical protein [Rhizobium mesoamericanum]
MRSTSPEKAELAALIGVIATEDFAPENEGVRQL